MFQQIVNGFYCKRACLAAPSINVRRRFLKVFRTNWLNGQISSTTFYKKKFGTAQ